MRGDHTGAASAHTAATFQLSPLREGRQASYFLSFGRFISFQLSPLREGRPHPPCKSPSDTEFQLSPLREGRQACGESEISACAFQLSPLREGRHAAVFRAALLAHFNSRPCVRGDDRQAARWGRAAGYFNSRPCVRGDVTEGEDDA